jgi:GDP-D-mannose dehydratase
VRLQRDAVQPQESAAGVNVCHAQDARALALMDAGMNDCLTMRNPDSLRDWGDARDFVEIQWRMLEQEQSENFVIATGHQ